MGHFEVEWTEMTQGITYQSKVVSLNSPLHMCVCVCKNCKFNKSAQ